MSDTNNTSVETNGTVEGNGTGHTNRLKNVKPKPAGGMFGALYALRDKNLPESTLVRKTGADGLSYAVRIPAASPLTVTAIAEAAKEHGGRVRVSDPEGGKSSSWGVTGEKAAETVKVLDAAE